MNHTIKITYTAVSAPADDTAASICRCFYPSQSASDNAAFDGTFYDTHAAGWGEGTTLEKFMKSVSAHPGLVAAIRRAISDGEFTLDEASSDMALYIGEVAPSLKDQGFTFEVTPVVAP